MRLFMTPGADAAYDRWLDPPEVHEEDGCDGCHRGHRENGEFVKGCISCLDEKCTKCNGFGWVGEGTLEEECDTCHGTGRVY